MSEKILITSALLYANGPLHFGHVAGAYLPADVYARFERLQGKEVLFVSGSDEYGVAITMSAEKAGRTPKEHVDHFHALNKGLFEKLQIRFDHYSRTTWEGHAEPVQKYFLELLENGFIEEKVTDQLYAEKEGRFLADRYVVGTCPKCGYEEARGDECPKCASAFEATDLGDPRSKMTGAPLTLKKTKHWFLLLEKFEHRLSEWIDKKEWKPSVVNFVKGYIEELRPRAITRDSDWGIPVPVEGSKGKVLYVWFDAPIGYISATMDWNRDSWRSWWCDEKTKLVHFIGKDNITFHAAIFPAMTMGQNEPIKLVDELPANEFYNLEGRQFSKSEGWFIDLEDFFTRYSADQIRYTIASNAPETSDSEFTWKEFQQKCNGDLLGKLGNLVNRTLVFAHKQCQGRIPALDLAEEDEAFLAELRALVDKARECFATFRLRRACQVLMEIAMCGNTYFDTKTPWKDAKEGGNRKRMETTIGCCLECLQTLALVSAPIIPETSANIWRLLGHEEPLSKWELHQLSEGQPLQNPKILFQKIEDAQIEEELRRLHAMGSPLKNVIDYEDFKKLDLRVGTILEAQKVPKSSKLLQLKVDIGTDVRQIVSGVRKHYDPEALIGEKVVVVANLKPVKLMGCKSQGMVLAGVLPSKIELVQVKDLPNGTQIN